MTYHQHNFWQSSLFISILCVYFCHASQHRFRDAWLSAGPQKCKYCFSKVLVSAVNDGVQTTVQIRHYCWKCSQPLRRWWQIQSPKKNQLKYVYETTQNLGCVRSIINNSFKYTVCCSQSAYGVMIFGYQYKAYLLQLCKFSWLLLTLYKLEWKVWHKINLHEGL